MNDVVITEETDDDDDEEVEVVRMVEDEDYNEVVQFLFQSQDKNMLKCSYIRLICDKSRRRDFFLV